MPVLYMERSSLEGLTEADIKKIINENEDSTKYQHLEGYYRGDHDILRVVKRDSTAPNNKIVNNMAKYITDTAVGYFIGKPVIYSSQDDAFLAALQDIFDYNDEQDENTEVAKTCSIDGDCFEMLYMDEDAQVRFVKVAPGNCIMIYETGYTTPMAALRFIYSRDKDDHPIKKVEFWTATDCWYFVSFNGGPTIGAMCRLLSTSTTRSAWATSRELSASSTPTTGRRATQQTFSSTTMKPS